MARIGIIGAGSWGIALSVLLHNNGHTLTVWSAIESEIEMLKREHEHKDKLPNVKLADDIVFTTDINEAVAGMDLLVLAVPSPFTRSTAHSMAQYVADGQIIVNVAKGIEESTLMTLSQVIEEEIPQADVAVLSGPSHAEEVGRGIPTTIVVGARSKETAEHIQNIFMSDVFRVYTSPDVLGIELGAALKNVVALAAGIADGLGYGDNTNSGDFKAWHGYGRKIRDIFWLIGNRRFDSYVREHAFAQPQGRHTYRAGQDDGRGYG